MSSRYTHGDGKRKSSMTHANRGWTCVCGQHVYGNGGKSSHQRSCQPWAEDALARAERRIAAADADGSALRLPELRRRWVAERDQLRERLGLTEMGDQR